MMNNLIIFCQSLTDYTVILTLQLALILVVRRPLRYIVGPTHAYHLWLLPALWAPLYFVDWSWLQTREVHTWVADSIIWVPVNMMSPALDLLPSNPAVSSPLLPNDSPAPASPGMADYWPAVLAGIWLAVTLGLFIRQGLSYRFFATYLKTHAIAVSGNLHHSLTAKTSIGDRVPLYTLAGLDSPALFGIVRPALLLPEDFPRRCDSGQRQLILSHEAVHLKRRDNLWNLYVWCFKTLFWFNPLVHLAYRCFRADQELSCDAHALRQSSAGQRRRYARTLLEAYGQTGSFSGSPIMTAWCSLNTIKERTAMITHYRQPRPRPMLFRASLLSLLLTGACFTALLTGTSSVPAQAANALPGQAIPVDRSVLSTPVAAAVEAAEDRIREWQFTAAQSALNEVRAMQLREELSDQEKYIFLRLTGDIALARRDWGVAVDSYSALLQIPELSQAQQEDALTHLGDAHIAAKHYKLALARFREAAALTDNRSPDHLFKIADTLKRLKQYDAALTAAQETFDAYGNNAPQAAYELLWSLTRDNEAKHRIHEELVARFRDPQDIARLALFTREDGSYDPRVLGGTVITVNSATSTPDEIRFPPAFRPLEFVRPEYPQEAVHLGKEGWNLVVVELDSSGAVINPVILDSRPDKTFDSATLNAISQFRFDPSQLEGRAADFDMVYVIRYELPKGD